MPFPLWCTSQGDGWIAEGSSTQYFIDPVVVSGPVPSPAAFSCSSKLPARLAVGAQGVVLVVGDSSAVRVRSDPGTTARQTNTLPAGRQFTVVDGPRCVDNLVWWDVQTNLASGWIAEGDATNYFTALVGVPIATLIPSLTPVSTETLSVPDTVVPTQTFTPTLVPTKSPTALPDNTPTAKSSPNAVVTTGATSVDASALQGEGLIAYTTLDGVFLYNPPDGSSIEISHDNSSTAAAWSPDGKSLYFSSHDGAYAAICNQRLAPILPSKKCFTLTVQVPIGHSGIDALAVAPDNSELVFGISFIDTDKHYKQVLYAVNSDGTHQRQLTDGSTFDGNPVFTLDGKQILFARNGHLYQLDLASAKLSQINAGVPDLTQFALSPDATKLAVTALSTGAVYVYDFKTAHLTQLTRTAKDTRPPKPDNCPRSADTRPNWSHDGALIGFIGYLECSHQVPNFTLNVMRRDGSNLQSLNIAIATVISFAWQPVPDISLL